MSDSESETHDVVSPKAEDGSKRKRKSIVPPEEELEIDVNLPEPPSKKAKRLEKKKAKKPKSVPADETESGAVAGTDGEDSKDKPTKSAKDTSASSKRSDYGIWIGNLPWSATKDSLRQFFVDHGPIDEKDITRLNMPAPTDKGLPQQRVKPQNKGFAYADFKSKDAFEKALALSEKLMVGRRVLIKNAKSFEGRPDKTNTEAEAAKASAKPATKRIFVGNLDFSITREELHEHFSQAGEIEDVHVATFEDSGKCKGYAWVRFIEIDSAEAAVRGFIFKTNGKGKGSDGEDDEDDASDAAAQTDDSKGESSKPKGKKRKEKKKQKWFINRLHGRPLRCEFAEDAQTRYKKRFGKEGKDQRNQGDASDAGQASAAEAQDVSGEQDAAPAVRPQRREKPFKKRDARTIAPGKALASAQRSTGAIVASAGKKVTFD